MPNIGRSDFIFTLIDLFFIIFVFNIFINFYFLYNLIQLLFFHNLQGSKLRLKIKKEAS